MRATKRRKKDARGSERFRGVGAERSRSDRDGQLKLREEEDSATPREKADRERLRRTLFEPAVNACVTALSYPPACEPQRDCENFQNDRNVVVHTMVKYMMRLREVRRPVQVSNSLVRQSGRRHGSHARDTDAEDSANVVDDGTALAHKEDDDDVEQAGHAEQAKVAKELVAPLLAQRRERNDARHCTGCERDAEVLRRQERVSLWASDAGSEGSEGTHDADGFRDLVVRERELSEVGTSADAKDVAEEDGVGREEDDLQDRVEDDEDGAVVRIALRDARPDNDHGDAARCSCPGESVSRLSAPDPKERERERGAPTPTSKTPRRSRSMLASGRAIHAQAAMMKGATIQLRTSEMPRWT